MVRRDLLWNVFRDPVFPLRGLRWLLDELPDDIWAWFGFSDELSRLLVARCYASEDVAGAGLVLARLVTLRRPRSPAAIESIGEKKGTIVRWIETCDAEQAIGVEALVNALINHDRTTAQALIDSASPRMVADRVQRATPTDGYRQGGLLGRLAFGSPSWKQEVVSALDRDSLASTIYACHSRDVGSAAALVVAIAAFDEALGLELAIALAPTVVEAMRENPRETLLELRELLWYVFHFGPSLVGLPKPDEHRTAIVRGIFSDVGVASLARAYQHASRRDWYGLDSVSVLLREAAPELARELSQMLDVTSLIPTFQQMDAYEIEHVLIALALGEMWEPAATVARLVCAPTHRMSWRAAALAPDAAVDVVTAGGTIKLSLSGGLPEWNEALAALGSVHQNSREAAKAILRAHVPDLADGLLYRQHNGGNGALAFLRVASEIEDESVLAAVRAMDLATAQTTWLARADGSDEERAVLAELVSIAGRAGGEAARLAQEVAVVLRMKPLLTSTEPDDGDDDDD